jgi:hypothetical protein
MLMKKTYPLPLVRTRLIQKDMFVIVIQME